MSARNVIMSSTLSNLILFIFTLVNICKTNPIVTTRFGQIKGTTGNYSDHKYEAFLGIPFAEPPLGHLRFQLPKPLNPTWSTPYEAVNFKDACIQRRESYFNFNISEDCLYLNLWRPESAGKHDGELLPVFYLIHGSGYIKKSGALPQNQGDVLAATQNVIAVNSNYRLGALGFAHGSRTSMPGNIGIYDTLIVLRWIRDNIRSFGGDPNRVTLAGQSAGSNMVTIIATLPNKFETQHLFSRLIMMSGVTINHMQADHVSTALSKTRLLATKVNCLSRFDQFESSGELSDETVDCLKKADAYDLLEAQFSEDVIALGNVEVAAFLPVYGTELITDHPMINHIKRIESIKDKPMLFGVEQDETTRYVSLSNISTMNDAYEFIKKRITKAIKGIKTDKIDYFYKFYFDDVDPTNSDEIKAKCVNFFNDMCFHCPSLILAEFFSQKSSNIHFYLNGYVGEVLAQDPGRPYGTLHADDIMFALGEPIRTYKNYTENDRKFGQLFSNLFGDFIKGVNFDDWPSIAVMMKDYESPQIIKKLDLPPMNVVFRNQEICMDWADLFNYSIPR
ncbi:acetylcholinesterase-1-like [Tetranychus urticae]|uniref:Carboxylic ester hydrolase n=1 Tax=Tetranychus urticae TaxID=32264 RepID=T1JSK3_TETUR|nr:acetylcholinesterase-1-like [Tetranychus urticae]